MYKLFQVTLLSSNDCLQKQIGAIKIVFFPVKFYSYRSLCANQTYRTYYALYSIIYTLSNVA